MIELVELACRECAAEQIFVFVAEIDRFCKQVLICRVIERYSDNGIQFKSSVRNRSFCSFIRSRRLLFLLLKREKQEQQEDKKHNSCLEYSSVKVSHYFYEPPSMSRGVHPKIGSHSQQSVHKESLAHRGTISG